MTLITLYFNFLGLVFIHAAFSIVYMGASFTAL
jgi:hypothetical protein